MNGRGARGSFGARTGRESLTLAILWLLGLCGVACERQPDLVALRHTAQSCESAAGSCIETTEKDAGQTSVPGCEASDSCPPPAENGATEGGEDDNNEPLPPCPGAPTCVPPQRVVERCETRACAPSAQIDTFCASDGALFALGDGCTSPDANPEFRYALCSQSDLVVKAPLQVQGDVAVDRDVNLSADISIDGELHYVRSLTNDGASAPQTTATLQETQKTCELPEALRVDVASSVQARATDNDNELATEQLAMLTRWSGEQTVTLPCGRYFLDEMDGDGSLTVNAQGNVALFVDGALSARGGLTIKAAPSTRVSLIVNGSVYVLGGLALGELADARHLLMAANQIHMESGENTIGGILYTQRDVLLVNGTLDVKGALFAERAQLGGATHLAHAQAAATAADSCEP